MSAEANVPPIAAPGLAFGADAFPAELSRFRCVGCGYGASCRSAPDRCPMCSGEAWERVYRRRAADIDWPSGALG